MRNGSPRPPWRRFGTVLVSLTLLAAACGDDDDGGEDSSEDGGSDGGGSDDPISIGISLSLTGDFSDNGQAAQEGYELWRDVINENGGILGRDVELTIVDDGSSPEQVVTNYENFINREGVDLVFGPYSSLLNLPAGQVAARNGYAFIEGMGNGPSVFEECMETLIYAGVAASDTSANVWADYVLSLPEDERPATAAYISLDDPFSAPAADTVQERFEEAGIETVYDELYSTDTTDLTPVIQAAAATNPDMVVAGSQQSDGWAQMRAMIQQDFSPELLFMMNGPTAVLDFPENVGAENTDGVFTTDNWDPRLDTEGNEEMVAAYTEAHGVESNEIDSTIAQAFAVGQMAQHLIEEVGEIDQEAMVAAARSGTFATVVGDVTNDECGRPEGAQPLFEWIDGALEVVYPEDVATADPVIPKPDWGTSGG